MARASQGPGDPGEPGDATHSGALRLARIRSALSRRPAPHQLRRRPHARPGDPRHPQSMTPRNTSTGAVLEAMILPALARGGYAAVKQQTIGTRCGGGAHKVDAIATRGDERILVSLKWQQTGGTAEQKVPFEVMCLADAVTAGHAARAFLVLGGNGWKLRDYFTSGKLSEHFDPRSPRPRRDARSLHQARQQRAALIVLIFTL